MVLYRVSLYCHLSSFVYHAHTRNYFGANNIKARIQLKLLSFKNQHIQNRNKTKLTVTFEH